MNNSNVKFCIMCCDPAVWIHQTQFNRTHFFCDKHAKVMSDFGDDNSYVFLEKIGDVKDVHEDI